MNAVTTNELAAVKEAHAVLGERIAKLEAVAAEPAPFFEYQGVRITLRHGERYAGTIIRAGERGYHLIDTGIDADDLAWRAAMDWAKGKGGELPDRVESALLFATVGEHFEDAAYWTRELHASASDYAWTQDFTNGAQGYWGTTNELRARPVRRLFIE